MKVAELAPRQRLEIGADRSVFRGFDQAAALQLRMYAVFGGLFAIPFLLEQAALVPAALATIAATLGAAETCRSRVTVDGDRVSVERRCLGIRYLARETAIEAARVEVWGTGDHGFPGDWPAPEHCELSGFPGSPLESYPIGHARIARELHRALAAELARFAERRESPRRDRRTRDSIDGDGRL